MRDSDWEILYDLYKTPNLTKVANMRYMTQPSITKRIKNIEIEFDTEILNRGAKGLTFTPEGEYLAKCAEEHIKYIKKVHDEVDRMKENGSNAIEIGSSYTYSKYVLTEELARYSRAHADVHIDVLNASSSVLFKKMLEGSIDAGFICGDYDGPIYKVLVAKQKAYVVTQNPIESTDQLKDMKYLAYTTNDKTAELLQGWWLDTYGKTPHVEMTVGLMDFAWPLIDHSEEYYTYCFLPNEFKNIRNLCMTPLLKADGTPVIRNTWFVYSTAKRQTRQLEEFIDYVCKEMKYTE